MGEWGGDPVDGHKGSRTRRHKHRVSRAPRKPMTWWRPVGWRRPPPAYLTQDPSKTAPWHSIPRAGWPLTKLVPAKRATRGTKRASAAHTSSYRSDGYLRPRSPGGGCKELHPIGCDCPSVECPGRHSPTCQAPEGKPNTITTPAPRLGRADAGAQACAATPQRRRLHRNPSQAFFLNKADNILFASSLFVSAPQPPEPPFEPLRGARPRDPELKARGSSTLPSKMLSGQYFEDDAVAFRALWYTSLSWVFLIAKGAINSVRRRFNRSFTASSISYCSSV